MFIIVGVAILFLNNSKKQTQPSASLSVPATHLMTSELFRASFDSSLTSSVSYGIFALCSSSLDPATCQGRHHSIVQPSPSGLSDGKLVKMAKKSPPPGPALPDRLSIGRSSGPLRACQGHHFGISPSTKQARAAKHKLNAALLQFSLYICTAPRLIEIYTNCDRSVVCRRCSNCCGCSTFVINSATPLSSTWRWCTKGSWRVSNLSPLVS